jgi:hypothetical protein
MPGDRRYVMGTLQRQECIARHRMGRRDRVETLERRIRRNLDRHLRLAGFKWTEEGTLAPPDQSKEFVRTLHLPQRRERLRDSAAFVRAAWPRLSSRFAAGEDIEPEKIDPLLCRVEPGSDESDLFRLATLMWRIPVSYGYGRRMRYLVVDQNNWKIMGLFALGDPVFNQHARDSYVGWSAADRMSRLVDVMDAYVMGSVPPYNSLLGGKVVSCLVRTREVRREFARRYGRSRGLISGARKDAKLVLVTTSSALGKSSVYDRLRLGGVQYFQPIGFTAGWGHFHVPDRLFEQMRAYLALRGHSYALNHQFGDGPNWRLRATRAAISLLGWNGDLLRHGVKREVYVCRLASNAEQVLRGESMRPRYDGLLGARQVSGLACARWVYPRAIRRPEFRDWTLAKSRLLLNHRHDGSSSLIRSPPPLDSPRGREFVARVLTPSAGGLIGIDFPQSAPRLGPKGRA